MRLLELTKCLAILLSLSFSRVHADPQAPAMKPPSDESSGYWQLAECNGAKAEFTDVGGKGYGFGTTKRGASLIVTGNPAEHAAARCRFTTPVTADFETRDVQFLIFMDDPSLKDFVKVTFCFKTSEGKPGLSCTIPLKNLDQAPANNGFTRFTLRSGFVPVKSVLQSVTFSREPGLPYRSTVIGNTQLTLKTDFTIAPTKTKPEKFDCSTIGQCN